MTRFAKCQCLLWVLLGLALRASLFSQSTNSFPEFKLQSARQYLRSISERVTAEAGTNANSLYIQARLESELGAKDAAEKVARQALQIDPKRADIGVFLADILIRQDRLSEAAQVLKQVVQAQPNMADAHRRLGMVLDRMGERKSARAALEKSVSLGPRDGLSRLLLGRLLLDTGETKAAAEELQKACELDPNTANSFYALSQAQSKLGQEDEARKTLEKYRELSRKEKAAMGVPGQDPKYDNDAEMRAYTAGVNTEIGTLLIRQGQEQDGEKHLREALRIFPDEAAACDALANLLVRQGKVAEVRPVLENLVRLKPTSIRDRVNLAAVLLQLKDNPAAVEQLTEVLKYEPNQEQALQNLVRYYLSSGQDVPQALTLCQRLVEKHPRAANYDLLGWAFFANGRTNEALTASRTAAEKEPSNPGYQERYRKVKQRYGVTE